MAASRDPPCNFYNLARRFAQSEDHFRLALTHGAVVIDAGEAQILERRGSKCLDESGRGFVGRGLAARDGGQESADGGVGHETCKGQCGGVYAAPAHAMQA
jgi:hypothetical protein